MATKQTGRVKFFSATKHFGFIVREGHPDRFVHEDAVIRSGFTVEQMVAGDSIEFDEDVDSSNRIFTALIHKINGKFGTPPLATNYLVEEPLKGNIVEFNQNDVVFGRIAEVKTKGAVLSIVARVRGNNTLARYEKTRLPSLFVPWVMVPLDLQGGFTIGEGFYYKLVVEVDARKQRYGKVIKIATDDDAPADEVEPVALTGTGSRGQPIMELGDPISIEVHPAELPAHITSDGTQQRTMQLA